MPLQEDTLRPGTVYADPYGHVLERTAIFEPAILLGEARFLRTSTLYARYGDVLAYASVAAVVALLLPSRRRVQLRYAYCRGVDAPVR